MKKKVLIIISLIIGLWIGFEIYKMMKPPASGYYIIDFENTEEELSEEEKDALVKLLNFDFYPVKEPSFINFTKLVYENNWLNEGSCYMVFKTNIKMNLFSPKEGYVTDGKNKDEYVYMYEGFNIRDSKAYKVIRAIVINHYKWWEEHEENLYNVIGEKKYKETGHDMIREDSI